MSGSSGPAAGSRMVALARLAAYLAWTVALIPVQAAAVALRRPLRARLPRFYHRVCTRLIGIRLVVRGTPAAARPVLFASNHSSYLDIMVLGALIEGSFVAKREVAAWPFFGLLAKLQRTVFVERRAREAGRQRDEIGARLAAGDRLILFPEGTSSDGNRVLPFKSALFGVAESAPRGQPLLVQPVSVAFTALDGMPAGRALRPLYAWYGDMNLPPHLWRALKAGRMTVEVEFHPPVAADAFPSRKALAEHCRRAVAAGVARALTGRESPRPEPGAVDSDGRGDVSVPA